MFKRFVRYYRPHLGLLILDYSVRVGGGNRLDFPQRYA